MRIALTGGSGFVGRFVAEAALAAGHELLHLSRAAPPLPGEHRPFDLLGEEAPSLAGAEALVHCAFRHVPGQFRGGEGDDPDGFRRANLQGTLRLVAAAGGRPVVFLSSRAVFDGYGPGTRLTEDLPPRPDSLYGRVKAEAEAGVTAGGGCVLRATGVYGPGKWSALFRDFRAGRAIPPRVATEVHGADVAAAVLRLLETGASGLFHASDLMLDRHDLLAEVARLTGIPHPPPPRAADLPNALDCARLRALGWRPGGRARLWRELPAMVDEAFAPPPQLFSR